jgi:hypothetical protein
MSIFELEIGWAATTDRRRYVDWELLACDEVCGVFPAARDDALLVLFSGDRRDFRTWSRSLTTNEKGVLQ